MLFDAVYAIPMLTVFRPYVCVADVDSGSPLDGLDYFDKLQHELRVIPCVQLSPDGLLLDQVETTLNAAVAVEAQEDPIATPLDPAAAALLV